MNSTPFSAVLLLFLLDLMLCACCFGDLNMQGANDTRHTNGAEASSPSAETEADRDLMAAAATVTQTKEHDAETVVALAWPSLPPTEKIATTATPFTETLSRTTYDMPRFHVTSDAMPFEEPDQSVSTVIAATAVAVPFTLAIAGWLIWGFRRERQLRREAQRNRRRRPRLPHWRDMSPQERLRFLIRVTPFETDPEFIKKYHPEEAAEMGLQ